jgi:hypothetical protein
MIKHSIRRTIAATTAALALTTLTAAGPAGHAVVPSGESAASGVHHQLDVARQKLKPMRSLDRAQRAGYALFTDQKGIACIDMPGMGGMGVHFVKGAEVANANERNLHPEALVYRLDENGKLRLAAVEYVVLASAWDATHSSPPSLYGHTFNFTKAGNRYGLPDYYSLHVWLWYHNPAGTFSMWNPRITCCC